MGKPSDVRVTHAAMTFRHERLAVPLHLSKGVIEEITYAQATVQGITRDGRPVQGTGAILLSDLWAFPHPLLSHEQKDRAMRLLCQQLAETLSHDGEYADPLEKGLALAQTLPILTRRVEEALPELPAGSMPRLAAMNCLAPLDAAIHDAWGRGLGGEVYDFYSSTWLNRDLGSYLGPGFQGHFPADFLAGRRRRLGVQHVVGLGDPLWPQESESSTCAPGLPAHLVGWIRRDGVANFKIKTRGTDPEEDVRRIASVYRVAVQAGLPPALVRLSIDPNEGCPDDIFLLEMLHCLALHAPDAYGALDYIEQPTPRDLAAYTFTLHRVAARKPVIVDESLDCLEALRLLEELGWSGLALKTCKGQTHCLLAYCWAKRHGLYVTCQDLTNPGLALVHSVNLCTRLDLSVDYLECNQRQYMPAACPEERQRFPHHFTLQGGCLVLPAQPPLGLY
ncbi:hypothetical protein FKZ61_012905 [Litorilinea aerophila]|uniref:Enolase C-terminal domain-containing protein n=1 Tax=Litorilinea aerophila TaxID=1204385 RepID=A0A540VER9_9CHLR|nr:enolase C-terminal domain-like protein [Litorilinea aerophila]MCC9077003.1 hypothetical protein [Litorilinea aerophila]OUC06028.1 hypothetical protein RY27_23565 [Litorilinea aerophila]